MIAVSVFVNSLTYAHAMHRVIMSVTKYEWYLIWQNDSLYVAIQNTWTKANALEQYMTVDINIEPDGTLRISKQEGQQ
ncbi:MAG: hypothetical protein RE471_04835 [Ferroplasma sp.]|jgi:hypothetical protein|uniref:hypothetical protein n=1 Tax=Ferroplasma sp. TaxID=2591003 RepID=UPI002814D462|nr:hypothetical protein [Ferroplasma sp.]WMT52207.1 MAG: hypothetical protein RE471_04835 [Ferroplasma sp.]